MRNNDCVTLSDINTAFYLISSVYVLVNTSFWCFQSFGVFFDIFLVLFIVLSVYCRRVCLNSSEDCGWFLLLLYSRRWCHSWICGCSCTYDERCDDGLGIREQHWPKNVHENLSPRVQQKSTDLLLCAERGATDLSHWRQGITRSIIDRCTYWTILCIYYSLSFACSVSRWRTNNFVVKVQKRMHSHIRPWFKLKKAQHWRQSI